MTETYLTKQGLEKMHAEHASLMKQKTQLTEEVTKAAAHGDLRENAEYHAARERLQHVAKRLAEVDNKLTSVRIIDDLEIKTGEARVGATVTLLDETTKEKFNYMLVGPDEADPANGKLSIGSPLGQSVLGKKKGDSFTLTLPRAVVPYKVLNVKR